MMCCDVFVYAMYARYDRHDMLFFQNKIEEPTVQRLSQQTNTLIRSLLHSHQIIMIFTGTKIIINNFTLLSSPSFSSFKKEDHLLYCSFDDRWSFCLVLGSHENLDGMYESLFVL